MNIIALIPARYQSSRLPGKPLLQFGDYTMIQRVYLQTTKVKLINQVYVVTDDERVKENIEKINGNIIMVTDDCLNGTERICLALKKMNQKNLEEITLVVNVQGDEPFINPKHISLAIEQMISNNDNNCVCSTLHYKITNFSELDNKNVGKLVLDNNNYIMYCSRNCIPGSKTDKIDKNIKYFGHIGVFVFKPSYLEKYMLSNTKYQLIEDIEWLKIIEQGYKIKSSLVYTFEIGVNVKEDYEYLINKYNLES